MRVSAKQIFIAVISMVLTLGVLFGGQRLYQSTVVESPLMSSLGSIEGVSHARIEGNTVTVQLNGRSDLMTVYQTLVTKATAALGHAPSNVVVVSHPDSALSTLASNVQFVVAQGEATGQFVTMKNTIEKMANQQHVESNLQLNAQHLFLTFHHHGAVLYDVVPVRIGGASHG